MHSDNDTADAIERIRQYYKDGAYHGSLRDDVDTLLTALGGKIDAPDPDKMRRFGAGLADMGLAPIRVIELLKLAHDTFSDAPDLGGVSVEAEKRLRSLRDEILEIRKGRITELSVETRWMMEVSDIADLIARARSGETKE